MLPSYVVFQGVADCIDMKTLSRERESLSMGDSSLAWCGLDPASIYLSDLIIILWVKQRDLIIDIKVYSPNL